MTLPNYEALEAQARRDILAAMDWAERQQYDAGNWDARRRYEDAVDAATDAAYRAACPPDDPEVVAMLEMPDDPEVIARYKAMDAAGLLTAYESTPGIEPDHEVQNGILVPTEKLSAKVANTYTAVPVDTLQRTPNGRPLSNIYNAIQKLSAQSVLLLSYDEFLQKVIVKWPDDPAPRPMDDADITRARVALQGLGLEHLSKSDTFDAMAAIAKRNTVNCVADYLNGLEWDGVRRLSLLMPRGFGTAATRYYIRAGRNLFISLVARGLNPGCQVDEAIVLEGPQGSLKSSALRIIGGDYFAELTASPNSKDFEQQLCGVWLGEFAELNALRRPEDIARIKQFITNRADHLRLPYGRVNSDLPRRTVLCGSTNEQCWLHDPTGGRRFIPVEVGTIDLEWLRENRDQLFAEAVALYKAKRKWWIYPKAEALEQQEARAPDDPWSSKVAEYCYGRSEIIDVATVLKHALGIDAERQSKAHATRVGVILRQLGCIPQKRRRIDGQRCRPWTVPVELANRPRTNIGADFTASDIAAPANGDRS